MFFFFFLNWDIEEYGTRIDHCWLMGLSWIIMDYHMDKLTNKNGAKMGYGDVSGNFTGL